MAQEYVDYRRLIQKHQEQNTPYLQRLIEGDLTPLDFLRDYRQKFPHLSALALRVFALAASRASCERNFSIMGFIHSKIRNKLGHEKVQMSTFIMHNYATLYPDDLRMSEHDDDDTGSLGGNLGVEDQEDDGHEVANDAYYSEEEEFDE